MIMQLIKISAENPIPLVGAIQFGIIERGTNLLQIRQTTLCNLKCTFCSTSANSETHPVNYEVEPDYLVQWLKEVIRLKECNNIEANIDSAGEPTIYPHLIKLIKKIKEIPEVKFISMQTNGTLLTNQLINQLEKAGLNRINVSIHSLDENLAKYLVGIKNYNLSQVLDNLKEISKTKIQLNITPVWLPNINDKEITKLIQLAKELNCTIGIQKYEIYKYSRKEKKAKQITWFRFYRHLKELEKQENIKLIQTAADFNIKKTKRIPAVLEKNELIYATIKCPGWFENQMIAESKNRAITVLDCNKNPGDRIKIRIISNSDSIYIAKKA